MRVIELNCSLLRQLAPIRIVALETAHQVGHGTRDQEIFLQESKSLPLRCGIVRIQHAGKRLRFESLAQSAHEVAGAKLLKIEVFGCRRGPEPERVDLPSAIAHHGTIKRNTDQARRPVRDDMKITFLQLE